MFISCLRPARPWCCQLTGLNCWWSRNVGKGLTHIVQGKICVGLIFELIDIVHKSSAFANILLDRVEQSLLLI